MYPSSSSTTGSGLHPEARRGTAPHPHSRVQEPPFKFFQVNGFNGGGLPEILLQHRFLEVEADQVPGKPVEGQGRSGGTPGNGTSPAFPDSSFGACLHALTVFPYSLYGIALCVGISGLLVFMVMRMGFGRKGTYSVMIRLSPRFTHWNTTFLA